MGLADVLDEDDLRAERRAVVVGIPGLGKAGCSSTRRVTQRG
jgi:hypothetical protein